MKFFSRFLIAASYVTCLPLYKHNGTTDMSGLTPSLPAVGLIVGGLLAALSLALDLTGVSALFCAVLLTLTWLALTNGIHMDGLMDTADGIYSHQDRERMLTIMQDPRVGNFGVLSGVALLAIKVVSLESLSGNALPWILIAAPVFARAAEAFAIIRYPYARAEGKGKIWHDSARYPGDLLASLAVPIILIVVAVCTGHIYVVTLALFATLAGFVSSELLSRKLGGQTGDTYGAIVELTEAGSICALALFSGLISRLTT